MATELATGYVTLLPSARGIAAGIERELGAPLTAASRTAGAKSSSAFGAAFKTGFKGLLASVAVVGGLAAIGKSFDNAFNTIARGTGASDEKLKGLDQSFKNVLRSGSGSMEQVATAITKVYQRTRLTGTALEDFAAKEVTLARITKTDVAANLESTTGLFNLYGVAATKQSDALDVLFRASQVAGVSITQLSSDMQSAAPTAKTLGLSIDQTAAIVANLDKAGLPASKVMLGLASTFAKAAKSGKEPLDVIHDLVDEVKKAPNATVAATIAVTKFGIGARQASTLVAGLRSGAIDLNATLDGGKGILETAKSTATLDGKLAHLKNVALVSLEPLANQVLGALLAAVQDVIPVVEALTSHMDVLGPVILTATAAFVAFKVAVAIENVVLATSAAFTTLQGALGRTAVAEADTAISTEAATVALGEEAVAAGAAATATGAAAISIGAVASIVAVAAIATVALGKTLYDLFAVSTKASLNVKKSAQVMATSLLDGTKNAVGAKARLDSLTQATENWFKAQKAADEQTGGAIIRNLGISYEDVTKAVTGSRSELGKWIDSLGLSEVNAQTLSNGLNKLRDSLQQTAKETINNFEHTKVLTAAQTDSALARTADAHGTNDYVAALKLLGQETLTVTAQQGATAAQLRIQRGAWAELTTAIINNTDSLNGADQSLAGLLGSSVASQQAVLDVADAWKTYQTFVKAGTQNTEEGQRALFTWQQAALGAKAGALGTAAGFESLAKDQSGLTAALKTQADALKKSGPDPKAYAAATDVVASKQVAFRTALEALTATTKGPVHDALVTFLGDTANLATETAKIPATKTVTYTTPGLATANTVTHNYRGELDGIPEAKTTTITVEAAAALHQLALLDDAIRRVNPNVSMSVIIAAHRSEDRGGAAHGAVVRSPTRLLVGEDSRTTPEIVSPVALMAQTFDAALAHHNSGSDGPAVLITGDVYTRDENEFARELENRQRRAEILAGLSG